MQALIKQVVQQGCGINSATRAGGLKYEKSFWYVLNSWSIILQGNNASNSILQSAGRFVISGTAVIHESPPQSLYRNSQTSYWKMPITGSEEKLCPCNEVFSLDTLLWALFFRITINWAFCKDQVCSYPFQVIEIYILYLYHRSRCIPPDIYGSTASTWSPSVVAAFLGLQKQKSHHSGHDGLWPAWGVTGFASVIMALWATTTSTERVTNRYGILEKAPHIWNCYAKN